MLKAGYQTSDTDLVSEMVGHMDRTVYLMALLLAEQRGKFVSSVYLQAQITNQIQARGYKFTKKFNPVHWFSQRWTERKSGHSASHFRDEYFQLFDRKGEKPTSYRIKPTLYERVVEVLSELRESDTAADVSDLAQQLDKEGLFDPAKHDARRLALRAIVMRQGQPVFRADLIKFYDARCAITNCDAHDALEAAHIWPYRGPATNTVSNGILLRADIHTLFDLDFIGIHPSDRTVHISDHLIGTVYRELEGTALRGPNDPSAAPDPAALAWRWERFNSRR